MHDAAHQDLAGLGLGAQARGEIGHSPDDAVADAGLVADRADGGVAVRDADAERDVVAAPAPDRHQLREALLHLHGHARRAGGGILDRDRVVEDYQHGARAELLQGPAVRHDEAAHLAVVEAQQAHHLLGLGGVRERGEAAQVEDDDGDLAPAGGERIVHVARDDALGQMRREEALELGQALQLVELLLHALFQAGIQLRQLAGLRLHGVVEGLDAQQRAHPREQLRRD